MDGYLFCGLSEQLETLEVRRSNLTRWWVTPDGWPDRAPRDVVRRCVVDAIMSDIPGLVDALRSAGVLPQ
jgi:hypothetical protein